MSSDQLGSIQQPVVAVDFDLSKDGHQSVQSIELSKEELDRFVMSLEAANKVSTRLSVYSYFPPLSCAAGGGSIESVI